VPAEGSSTAPRFLFFQAPMSLHRRAATLVLRCFIWRGTIRRMMEFRDVRNKVSVVEDLSASSPTKKVPPRPSLSSRSSRHRASLRDEPNQSNNCAQRLLACMLYQSLKRGNCG
jgi:hypothetical protein